MVNEDGATVLFGDETPGRVIYDMAAMPVQIIGVLRNSTKRSIRHNPTIYYDETNHAGPPRERIALARVSAPVVSKLETAELASNVVSPAYFDVMGFSLVAGRSFSEHGSFGGCRVALVNEEAADLYFGGGAIGAVLIDELGERSEIIGIVHTPRLGIFQRKKEPTVYFPMVQDCRATMTLAIRAGATDSRMLAAVQHVVESAPGRGPARVIVKTLETQLNQTALAPLHIATVLMTVLCCYCVVAQYSRTIRDA
jgi:hypothetical protein